MRPAARRGDGGWSRGASFPMNALGRSEGRNTRTAIAYMEVSGEAAERSAAGSGGHRKPMQTLCLNTTNTPS